MLVIQLYTVRDQIEDMASALEVLTKLKAMGYECVQLAGDLATIQLTASAAKQTGIAVVGILAHIQMFEEQEQTIFDIARSCGAKDLGISSDMQTEQDACDIIARANAFAKKARAAGFSFSYHNHSNEFIRGEHGKTLMQLLKEGFDPALVDFMPDTYWLQHGGADVRDFLESVKGRVHILHLKDMKRTPQGQTFAEIGVGNINFKGIAATAKAIGVQYFIVEQDSCDGDSLASARISCEYVKTLL